MSDSLFRFKRFTVCHQGAAMKVGTDGVLIGAWAGTESVRRAGSSRLPRILDIGTGTGLIALMMAQRTENIAGHRGAVPSGQVAIDAIEIDAIEIDAASCRCAAANVAASPWCDRISVHNVSLQEFAADPANMGAYDHIVSNPPYFVNSLLPPQQARGMARHAGSLSYAELAAGVARLLSPGGSFAVILPADTFADFCCEARKEGLGIARQCTVYSLSGGPAKRIMAEFVHFSSFGGEAEETELMIECGEPRDFSPSYRKLTRDFYLKF